MHCVAPLHLVFLRDQSKIYCFMFTRSRTAHISSVVGNRGGGDSNIMIATNFTPPVCTREFVVNLCNYLLLIQTCLKAL